METLINFAQQIPIYGFLAFFFNLFLKRINDMELSVRKLEDKILQMEVKDETIKSIKNE